MNEKYWNDKKQYPNLFLDPISSLCIEEYQSLGPYSQGRPTFLGTETRAQQVNTSTRQQSMRFHKIYLGSLANQNACFIGLMRFCI